MGGIDLELIKIAVIFIIAIAVIKIIFSLVIKIGFKIIITVVILGGILIFAGNYMGNGKILAENVMSSISVAVNKVDMPSWLTYYNQEDEKWGDELYGTSDYIKDAGCGPTVLAMAVSTLTDFQVTPLDMASWSYENGYYCEGSGSYHTLIGDALSFYGLDYTVSSSKDDVINALKNNNIVIALMGEGHFTKSGHFIILCDIDDDNTVFVADPKHEENMEKRWDIDLIDSETKVSPTVGGCYWIINKAHK